MIEVDIPSLLNQIEELQQEALRWEEAYADWLQKVHPAYQQSSRNLLHYLALRQYDIRNLQVQLAALGLSSLGRVEGHVLDNLQAITKQLQTPTKDNILPSTTRLTSAESNALLAKHTDALLGQPDADRETRIMVTFSTDLASNSKLIEEMLTAGMNCARINCAHDDAETWARMVKQIKKAEQSTGKQCKVLFDLMGPKLRTGPLKPGPQVVFVQPEIDQLGQVIGPALLWIGGSGSKLKDNVNVVLPVTADWLDQVKVAEILTFTDARGRSRELKVVQKADKGLVVQLTKTAYILSGTEIKYTQKGTESLSAIIEELPSMEIPLLLKKGHELILHKEEILGEPAIYDENGTCLQSAHISCTLPEIFEQVKAGEPIVFDDGEIEGIIKEVLEDRLRIEIISADEKGSKLRADKGINLPESNLSFTHLTHKDIEDLSVIAPYADIINLSFVNAPEIVEELQQELKKLNAGHIGIMLKIETKAGFSNLPHLLLTVMRNYPAGIMIARGDLAVECGWERLAEVQEEILWISEAAHLPAVWATQVLEKLAKKGKPTRSEITDAAMAQRADCVMLNKGPYIVKTINMLRDILIRMQAHQNKKTPLLRQLHLSVRTGATLKKLSPES